MKWERKENIDNMVVFTLIASASRQHPLNRYVSKACFCSHSICLLAANSPPNVVATPFCLRFQSPYPGVGQCARRRLRSKRLSPPLILHGQCMVYRCFPSYPPVVLVRVSYGWSCRGGVGVFNGRCIWATGGRVFVADYIFANRFVRSHVVRSYLQRISMVPFPLLPHPTSPITDPEQGVKESTSYALLSIGSKIRTARW